MPLMLVTLGAIAVGAIIGAVLCAKLFYRPLKCRGPR